MLKFLPGIMLIQLMMVLLVLAAVNWLGDVQLIFVIIAIALIMAMLVAFWFSSIAQNIATDKQSTLVEKHVQDREKILKDAERDRVDVLREKSDLQSEHAREREQILLDAEREKAHVVEENYKKVEKAHTKANVKVGLAFLSAVSVAGVMIFSQLVTLGMMFLVASGSGLSGYVLRARHEGRSRKKLLSNEGVKQLDKVL
ncbi:MAG: hypothetical protein KAG19_06210 [Methylococcales bacterium]|nr:hypothetical protein [Methylococcales bacterium]